MTNLTAYQEATLWFILIILCRWLGSNPIACFEHKFSELSFVTTLYIKISNFSIFVMYQLPFPFLYTQNLLFSIYKSKQKTKQKQTRTQTRKQTSKQTIMPILLSVTVPLSPYTSPNALPFKRMVVGLNIEDELFTIKHNLFSFFFKWCNPFACVTLFFMNILAYVF